ncbi:MAG: hypothetical protein IKU38_02630 [Clostridia bacterium]|nr:hypothetical protein [Clostridia bacterium]
MVHFNVSMKHTEQSIEKLAHMQYDLFCKSNLIARTMIGMGAVVFGIANLSAWWGVLLIAYGSYLATGKYNAANHTAHKLCKQIKESGMEFPSSRYVFRDNAMEIIPLPENTNGVNLMYKEIRRLGEDMDNFYVFRDQYGGYVIPKVELGEREADFRVFLEKKAQQSFRAQMSPLSKLLRKRKS